MTLDKREATILYGITLLGLIVRVAFVFFMGAEPLVYDSKMYLMVADGIVNESPISSFPNGYPLVIALFRSFLPTAQTINALLLLNVLLSTASIPLTYLFCKSCRLDRWVPIGTCILIAVYPHQLRYAQLVMTETIATTTLLGAMVGAIWIWNNRYAHQSKLIPYCLSTGLLFHITGAIRPSLLLIGILISVLFALLTKSIKISLTVLCGFLIGASLLFVIEKSPQHVLRMHSETTF